MNRRTDEPTNEVGKCVRSGGSCSPVRRLVCSSVFMALLVSWSAPVAVRGQTRPKIIVITHGQASDSFWLTVRNGVETAASETNSDVTYRAPEKFDLTQMNQMINDAVKSRPDGLVVSIPDANALRSSIQAAVAAKIPVISMNAGMDISLKLGCLMFVGQQEESAGREAGRRMKAMGVKNALILNQETGNATMEQRIGGFRAGFEGPFHHLQVLPVSIDFGECHKAVVAYLEQHDEVDGIQALGPIAAEPAFSALEDTGRLTKVKFGTFDISPFVADALAKKQMSFAIDQQQWLQGYLPIIFLANFVKFGCLPQNNLILTGPSFVTPENAGKVVSLLSLGFK
jgi:simple sugar transport system substrate-binding protein